MSIYKEILLYYDGTREGREALSYGANLSMVLGAKVHLISVFDLRASIVDSLGIVSELAWYQFEQNAQHILQEGTDWLTRWGIVVNGHLGYGTPVDEIVRAATELGIDLVIIGHRHRGYLARWWAGDGLSNLQDRLPCSVLSVKCP
ncbi:universal stress protein [Burkholderia territorii]|uniref:universal stress protein n=1 Tax=Burkholderia territorii TaxID=1503055 RepID=UPI0009BCCCAF|nr:universal stress protein [Burkholderia territorii]